MTFVTAPSVEDAHRNGPWPRPYARRRFEAVTFVIARTSFASKISESRRTRLKQKNYCGRGPAIMSFAPSSGGEDAIARCCRETPSNWLVQCLIQDGSGDSSIRTPVRAGHHFRTVSSRHRMECDSAHDRGCRYVCATAVVFRSALEGLSRS